MERAAELEAEVERLQAELDAAKVRVADDAGAQAETEEVKALRVANVTLRRDNDRLRELLAEIERKPRVVPRAFLALFIGIFAAIMLAIVAIVFRAILYL